MRIQIEAIYLDGVVTISDHQVDADWGLQRISQRSKLTRSDTAATDYTYDYLQPAGEDRTFSPSLWSDASRPFDCLTRGIFTL